MGWLVALALYVLGIPGHADLYALVAGKARPDRASYALAALWPVLMIIILVWSDGADKDR